MAVNPDLWRVVQDLVPRNSKTCALAIALLLGVSCRTTSPPPSSVTVCVELHPDAPQGWLPEGDAGGDEYKRGNICWLAVSWSGPDTVASVRVRVVLVPTHNPGCSTNSGSDTLPDLYFERELNPHWDFGQDATDKIPGVQSLIVEATLDREGARRLAASCFDWGANFRVQTSVIRVGPK